LKRAIGIGRPRAQRWSVRTSGRNPAAGQLLEGARVQIKQQLGDCPLSSLG
jgi:hypothetical protein